MRILKPPVPFPTPIKSKVKTIGPPSGSAPQSPSGAALEKHFSKSVELKNFLQDILKNFLQSPNLLYSTTKYFFILQTIAKTDLTFKWHKKFYKHT